MSIGDGSCWARDAYSADGLADALTKMIGDAPQHEETLRAASRLLLRQRSALAMVKHSISNIAGM